MKKNIFLSLTLAVLVVVGIFTTLHTKTVSAGQNDNVTGWAWSSTTGWISLNCVNTGTCGIVDYGVNIDDQSGQFSGYGWSSNIGWVSFGANGCGPSPVMNITAGTVTGFAQAVGPNQSPWNTSNQNGGWGGCISMSGNAQNGSSYGVTINPTSGVFNGYAWNGDSVDGNNSPDTGMGWIDFSYAQVDINPEITGSITLDTTPVFSGECGDTAYLTWNYSDINPSTCTMDRNGSFLQDINPDVVSNLPAVINLTTQYRMSCEHATFSDTLIQSNLLTLSCSSADQCDDGIDNDRDGATDSNDTSCHSDCNAQNSFSYDPLISDESRTCAGTTLSGSTEGGVPPTYIEN